ncbi:MAG: DNA polymerase ligase N-terminal domain-containing protein [Bryobacteraceae bacterium]
MPQTRGRNKYRKKRDFQKTGEPYGNKSWPHAKPVFVVQKHGARSLHYDFRLEVDGTLKSWAVPKGPSTNPKDKRLAIATEDHPMEYARFEGVIPKGEYGAGAVIVWDRGTYANLTERNGEPVSMAEALAARHIVFRLSGKKLKGGYALTGIGKTPNQWLLVKLKDEYAGASNPVRSQPKSVLSGRRLQEAGRK